MRIRWAICGVGLFLLALGIWRWQNSTASENYAAGRNDDVLVRWLPEASEPQHPKISVSEGVPERIVPEAPASSTTSESAPEPPALLVRVVDEAARPIADASVALFTTSPLTHIPTDNGGLATIDVMGNAEADIIVRHPDFRFATAHAVMAREGMTEVTVMLRRFLTACIKLESDTGAPVGGAVVRFRESEEPDLNHLGVFLGTTEELEDFLMRDLFQGQFQESRISQPDGSCCITGISAGPISISVEAPGFVSIYQQVFDVMHEGGSLGILRLERGVTIGGTVRDAIGPVPMALVEGFCGPPPAYRYAFTDDTGYFEVGHVMPSSKKQRIRASHPERGDYYNPEYRVGDPLDIQLKPSVLVTLRLLDGDSFTPLEGEYTRLIGVPDDLVLHRYSLPKTLELVDGETVPERVPYFSKGMTFEVAGRPRVFLELARLAEAEGTTLEVLLRKPEPFLVRAIDKMSGAALVGGELHSILKKSVNGRAGKFQSRVASSFDAVAGGYYVEASRFNTEPGRDEYLLFTAPGYKPSEPVLVSKNGEWVAGRSVEVQVSAE